MAKSNDILYFSTFFYFYQFHSTIHTNITIRICFYAIYILHIFFSSLLSYFCVLFLFSFSLSRSPSSSLLVIFVWVRAVCIISGRREYLDMCTEYQISHQKSNPFPFYYVRFQIFCSQKRNSFCKLFDVFVRRFFFPLLW